MAGDHQWHPFFLSPYLVVALPALSVLQPPLTGAVLAKGEKMCVFPWETNPSFSTGIPHDRLRFSRFVTTESGCIIWSNLPTNFPEEPKIITHMSRFQVNPHSKIFQGVMPEIKSHTKIDHFICHGSCQVVAYSKHI